MKVNYLVLCREMAAVCSEILHKTHKDMRDWRFSPRCKVDAVLGCYAASICIEWRHGTAC